MPAGDFILAFPLSSVPWLEILVGFSLPNSSCSISRHWCSLAEQFIHCCWVCHYFLYWRVSVNNSINRGEESRLLTFCNGFCWIRILQISLESTNPFTSCSAFLNKASAPWEEPLVRAPVGKPNQDKVELILRSPIYWHWRFVPTTHLTRSKILAFHVLILSTTLTPKLSASLVLYTNILLIIVPTRPSDRFSS